MNNQSFGGQPEIATWLPVGQPFFFLIRTLILRPFDIAIRWASQ